MVKHFYPDVSDHFQRNNVSIHRVTGVTEQFDDDEDRMPDLNKYLWDILLGSSLHRHNQNTKLGSIFWENDGLL